MRSTGQMGQHGGFSATDADTGKLDLAELAASSIAQVAGADWAGLESHYSASVTNWQTLG